ncbi:hypothetical protein [Skermanella stibiiresistens]|uniref:hypothetical protein n=1 Tax=Skermanella stibiiresistens TaxID=913326 RepID=UPI0012F83B4E|nr:hypothetical protein [Skermanella stibiiresistens]
MVDSAAYARYVLPINHPEAQRMAHCRELDIWNNHRRCNSAFCLRCRKSKFKQEKKLTGEFFDGIPNKQLAQLTLLLPVISHLGDDQLNETIKRAKDRLRNFLKRQRRQDARWDRVSLRGFWEVEPLKVGEWSTFSGMRQQTLEDLDMPVLTNRSTVWLPHLHAIVSLGEITPQEFKKALKGVGYAGAYQVKVQPFYRTKAATKNLACTLRYHMKVDIRRKDPNGELVWWDKEDIRELADWLGSKRSGWEALRFSVYAHDERIKNEEAESNQVTEMKLEENQVDDASFSGMSESVERGTRDHYIYNNYVDAEDDTTCLEIVSEGIAEKIRNSHSDLLIRELTAGGLAVQGHRDVPNISKWYTVTAEAQTDYPRTLSEAHNQQAVRNGTITGRLPHHPSLPGCMLNPEKHEKMS